MNITQTEIINRYLKLTKWMKRRYIENGLIVMIRNGVETKYSILERMFFMRYITQVI